MKDDDKITLTLAELRAVAVAGYCSELCGKLATSEGCRSQGFCDDCASKEAITPAELDSAKTIRAVQARIDGLSAQPEARWAIEHHGFKVTHRGAVLTWPTETDALAWAEWMFLSNSYKVVRL